MANVTWDHDPPTTWIATVSGQAVCFVKRKDIGGWTAGWTDERLWPAPSHLPKALPQATRFFSSLEEAKLAVEHALSP
ncbi:MULTISPECIES: hypothetical protein [Acidovorax]|uniref:hypothetical protein n=1 Tax=Acidovorax TaxID=12916 RepID=UPI000495810F|nr:MULTISPECIES: hypothetical protein [Acidovorax]KRD56174.1 hypothetical protein ASE52_01135 [Acidovorax sp. Root275]MBD9394402.1 hypothetical protein [Acidovorax sp. ACV01]